ncbi:MAG TPA: DUF4965 domain-containing protein [Chitinophagaceae bacterium]|nr:DUF4965 domain-containing protein [Chitinophagaceae bacterium]
MKKVFFVIAITLVGFSSGAQDFRAPAYPLITVDPYFSIWSFNNTLYGGPTRHWTGKENSLQGIIRVDGHPYYFLGEPIPQVKTILPLVGEEGSWKYTFSHPSGNWYATDFNAASWKQAKGAFSDGNNAPNTWKTHDIWTRRTFSLETTDFDDLELNLYHDDNVVVYINGVQAYQATGWTSAPKLVAISAAAKDALKKGENVLAIHCENTAGGAYLDAGLVNKLQPSVKIPDATQNSVRVSATQTFYTFKCGGVALEVTFTDPLLPGDLNLFSRPADYITFKTHALDGASHKVQLYFSAAGNIAVNTPDQKVTWERTKARGLRVMRVGTVSQKVLGRKGDDVRIDWGYLYLSAPEDSHPSSVITASAASVSDFTRTGSLKGADDKDKPRPAGSDPVTLATAYDLGTVSSDPVTRHVILAYDDLYAIEYFHQRLKAWWKKSGMSTPQMLGQAEQGYKRVLSKCDAFDQQLHEQTVRAGGEKYAQLCELAYRQAMAACKLAEGPKGKPLFFTKECFSNGDISTVDVIYPTSPVLLYYSPVLMKGLMDPIFYYCESGHWTKPYSPHDLGTYPVANGRKVEEAMPIEESGNMLIMAAAVSHADGNADYVGKHWDVLTRWAAFLLKNGMDPKNQLTTDDFAGRSAHNANLSVKAIMGLACYGKMAGMLGKKDVEKEYMDTARRMARKWISLDQEGDHYKLTFDRPGTWSQKYNLVWDKVLKLHIFPEDVAPRAIAYYLTKQNTYGLPLDSRATYTKSDWINWTATLAKDKATFERFIGPLYKYVTETPTRVPMSDWYETTNAKKQGFQARSVVGGYFIKALDDKWNP